MFPFRANIYGLMELYVNVLVISCSCLCLKYVLHALTRFLCGSLQASRQCILFMAMGLVFEEKSCSA